MKQITAALAIVDQLEKALSSCDLPSLIHIVGQAQNDETKKDSSINEIDWLNLRDTITAAQKLERMIFFTKQRRNRTVKINPDDIPF